MSVPFVLVVVDALSAVPAPATTGSTPATPLTIGLFLVFAALALTFGYLNRRRKK
ncbi:LPXTG cell wall anchor domain-containing protein [Tersicoccus sp. MR15.9]|uniref:LPXTG cell wall anchor domain-containing protein n=1 Tax=Tersicoccus mangrovi TaxID=3121635 RepID=UPI002FE5552F